MSLPSRAPSIDVDGTNADRDVTAGFPVKRFVLMLVYANMICLGGAFATLMAFGMYSLAQFSLRGYSGPGVPGFLQLYKQAVDQLWNFAMDDLSQSARFLFLAIVPGTIAGIVWYLILRWRESVILRKRLRAAKTKAKASRSPISSA